MKIKLRNLPVIFLAFPMVAYPQKPPIDTAAFSKWPSAPHPNISNDGNYICYSIKDSSGAFKTVVRSGQTNWKIDLPGVNFCSLTQDSRHYIFLKSDSLYIGVLGIRDEKLVTLTNSFQIFNKEKFNNLLIYKPKDSTVTVLKDLLTGDEKRLQSVNNYWLSRNAEIFLWEIHGKSGPELDQLMWLNLKTDSSSKIWEGKKLESLLMDENGTSIAFIGREERGSNDLWYFENTDRTAQKLVERESPELKSGFQIKGIKAISPIDHRVFFIISKKDTLVQKKNIANVNVWSYKDPKLQSQQILELNNEEQSLSVVDVKSRHVLNIGNNAIKSPLYSPTGKQEYILVAEAGAADDVEWNWNSLAKTSVYLLSLKDGSKRLIGQKENVLWNGYSLCVLSPGQNYVVYFNPNDKNYYSYAINSGIVRNLTGCIKSIWTSYDRNDEPASNHYPIGIACFTAKDSAVLIYSQHDIFQIDLSGKKSPLNLTNGYGKKNNIVFELVWNPKQIPVKTGTKLLLSVFNRVTKDNGFFNFTVGVQKDPTFLTMQPYRFKSPVKSRDTDSYLVERMSTSESPNSFYTADFKTFKRMTDIRPEKAYNWLTEELVNFTTLDGRNEQGVLYRPENFDSSKSYPIIFQYYERKSNNIHDFKVPNFFGDEINIPYFVSNGYLVFTPDIHYQVGHPGRSAYNSILGAAKFLSKRPWIDSTKMGLQGHSFGGFETLYLITHSHFFAAAMAASPMSDFVSAYGSIIGHGRSRQRQYEIYRDRIGTTLWQGQSLYIENSPVLKADQVTTPVLIMSNDKDSDVPFQQGIEFFTALRRLGKKAWLLQYDGADHWAMDDNAKDYTIRVKQFFDYYLKGLPPSRWMTEGIPAKLKGIDGGLELDTRPNIKP